VDHPVQRVHLRRQVLRHGRVPDPGSAVVVDFDGLAKLGLEPHP
jgi:hypothetical protein